LAETGRRFGLETLLAAAQILDQAVARMRQSTHVRTLVEVAIVRICHLDQLEDISALIASLQQSGQGTSSRPLRGPAPSVSAAAPRTEQKKKAPLGSDSIAPPPSAAEAPSAPQPSLVDAPALTSEWNQDSLEQHWRSAIDNIGGMTSDIAGNFDSLAIPAPNVLVVAMKAAYNKEWCERPEVKRKLEQEMTKRAGRSIRIDFAVEAQSAPKALERRAPAQNRVQRMRQLEQHPLVQEAIQLFDAEIVRVLDKKEQ
jgi:DNA polymerase-3 subunit gamma/tau